MKASLIGAIVAVVLLGACGSPKAPASRSYPEYLPQGGSGSLPFSEAVRVGDMLFLSGQLGTDPVTKQIVPGGIAAETRQTLENIKKTLEKYGSSMDRVVTVTVMLADMGEWAEMNKVYGTYFPVNRPARNAFGTAGLALGARVEIVCIAVAEMGQ
jgi:2-iminobutanoate/2-iminopropanoate deaminase